MRKKINILVMPTDICNMNCVYCFHNTYHEKSGKMSLDTLKKMYDTVFASYKDVLFIWHGGEPLCMGKDFYEEAFKLQKLYQDVHIVNRMQSNLTLLTDDFADLLCENNVSVGTSYDGINNETLRGNSKAILTGRQKLIHRGKQCGFIMVLSNKNIDTLIESYEKFKELRANFSINPYVSTNAQNNDELVLDSDLAAEKLNRFFDYWINDVKCNVHVDYFERIIRFILFKEKTVCKYSSCLGKWMGIRYDGTIVPCNRFFPEKYNMGNVWDYIEISEAFNSQGFKLLLKEAIDRRYKCQQCEIFAFCAGGCNNVALNENGISNNNGTTCKITKSVYKHIMNYMRNNKESVYNPVVKKIISKRRIVKGCHCDMHFDSYENPTNLTKLQKENSAFD